LFHGERAPPNPWGATGLEWQTTSPPPTVNFVEIPVVTEGPYAYPPHETVHQQNV
jgi:cytochrome c oxidase subunit 1